MHEKINGILFKSKRLKIAINKPITDNGNGFDIDRSGTVRIRKK